MRKAYLLLVALLFVSCATRSPQTAKLLRNPADLPVSTVLDEVPFRPQKEFDCGPATAWMMLQHRGALVPLEELTARMYTAKRQGTFQTDLLSAIRREKFLAVEVSDLRSLLTEISSGNPVLVFQNLGNDALPTWHYAVAVGFDLKKSELILRSGNVSSLRMDLGTFERSWQRAGHWAITVIRPGKLSATGGDLAHVTSAAALEEMGFLPEAEMTYESVLKTWPQSLSALIGIGNITYARNDFHKAVQALKLATQFHPESPQAWHNLAVAQLALKRLKDARLSSEKALSMAPKAELGQYQRLLESLK